MPPTIEAGIMPLAAAIVSRRAGLPEHDSVLYTAAALASPTILGLAPALIATQGAGRPPRGGIRGEHTRGELVDVPDVFGKTEVAAVEMITAAGLRPRVRHAYYTSKKPMPGLVIEQSPESEPTIVRRGSIVEITISDGLPPQPEDPLEARIAAAVIKALDARDAAKEKSAGAGTNKTAKSGVTAGSTRQASTPPGPEQTSSSS